MLSRGRALDWFDLAPKVELHLHLEGSIPYRALWHLVGKYGGDPGLPEERKGELSAAFCEDANW